MKRVPKSVNFYAAMPENRFEFEVPVDDPNGDKFETFSLPKFQYINPTSEAAHRMVQASRDNDTSAQLVKDVVALLDPELGVLVAKLEDDQLQWISVEWANASNVSVPESSASSSSSRSTKRPSNTTSSRSGSGSARSAKKTSPSVTS